jgi:inorganic pyrophosphatase
LRDQIAHFFRHYKDLEKNKWVNVVRWAGPDEAGALIMQALDRARSK